MSETADARDQALATTAPSLATASASCSSFSRSSAMIATARSICSRVCSLVMKKRSRAEPSGTAGWMIGER